MKTHTKPAISVVVPNFNHEGFLRRRLNSIFNQTFEDFEVILLDDASSDNSRLILETYANDPRVAYFESNSTNSGSPFKQWAKGLSLCRGEFIWIAETDDWASPFFLEKTFSQIDSDTSIGLVTQNSYIVDDRDRIYERTNYRFNTSPTDEDSKMTRYSGKEFLVDNMLYNSGIYNASGVLFRRKLTANFPELARFKQAGDSFFWCHLLSQSDIVFLKGAYNYFRRHDHSTTFQNYRSSFIPVTEMYDRIRTFGNRLSLSNETLDFISENAFRRTRAHIRLMRKQVTAVDLFTQLTRAL